MNSNLKVMLGFNAIAVAAVVYLGYLSYMEKQELAASEVAKVEAPVASSTETKTSK